ncbi:MAG TPA: dihydrodipicolinate synthase family protein [Burkholderiales bacterium]|nr:dihydrodipicolinate synthase family protein [Burkholderiales bacterium]
MPTFTPGLVHTPVTPFSRDDSISWAKYGKLIDFHLANGAEALALPMHVGESVSLTDEEQRKLLKYALKRVGGKVPVIAHVSDSGTGIAAERAAHAEKAGAAAIIITTPYYWTPPADMLLAHFDEIGAAVSLPFYLWYAPEEMRGPKITPDLVLKLIASRPNFAGVVDSSNDWQFQINVLSSAQRVRPDFQLACGTEYMGSAGANGATSLFSALAGVAPATVKRLYEICRKEDYFEARKVQAEVAAIYQAVKAGGFAGLKTALKEQGRDCGIPRPPMEKLDTARRKRLVTALGGFEALQAEPKGW